MMLFMRFSEELSEMSNNMTKSNAEGGRGTSLEAVGSTANVDVCDFFLQFYEVSVVACECFLQKFCWFNVI